MRATRETTDMTLTCAGCQNNPRVSDALDFLASRAQRATYGALAERANGRAPVSVMSDHAKDDRHAWIVNGDTGLPTGFSQKPPNLIVNKKIIRSPAELEAFLASGLAR